MNKSKLIESLNLCSLCGNLAQQYHAIDKVSCSNNDCTQNRHRLSHDQWQTLNRTENIQKNKRDIESGID